MQNMCIVDHFLLYFSEIPNYITNCTVFFLQNHLLQQKKCRHFDILFMRIQLQLSDVTQPKTAAHFPSNHFTFSTLLMTTIDSLTIFTRIKHLRCFKVRKKISKFYFWKAVQSSCSLELSMKKFITSRPEFGTIKINISKYYLINDYDHGI